MNNSKKRKYNEMVRKYSASELNIRPVEYLNCVICLKPVYNFQMFQDKDCVTCSYDCYCVAELGKKNTLLHEKEDKIKSSFE